MIGYVCLCPFAPLYPWEYQALCCDIGNSTISNQLVAGSIIVTHIKSICVLSLPLRVYGPMRSTHNASQGLVIASFVGSLPYLSWSAFVHLATVTLFDM